jgi:sortase A
MAGAPSACILQILDAEMRLLRWPEKILTAIGCGCLAVVLLRDAQAESSQRIAAAALDQQLTSVAPAAETHDVRTSPDPAWSAVPEHDGLVGRLEIPRLSFSVMVLEGDDTATLARAVGHMPGTAFPWESGNVVMAGHRDTFFRPLENLRTGDEIRMTTLRGTFHYRVTSTEIVQPSDVSVIAPTRTPALTLVTCYPFVYVGRAPQRFIIHAQ